MIDLVFLKFVRKCLLSLFFIVVCAFDFYGMNDKFNLENGPLEDKKNIDSFDSKELEEKIEYLGDNQSDMRFKLNQDYKNQMNYSINNQIYYQDYYNLQTNKKGNNRGNMLLSIQNNFTLEKSQEEPYFIDKGTPSPFFHSTFKGSKKGTSKNNEENATVILQDEKTKRISEFLNNPTYSERINKYPFADPLSKGDGFLLLWKKDFEDTCKNLFPEEDTDEFKTFLEFHFCHKIIKKEGISKYGPFLSDNAEKVKDFLEEVPLLRQKVSLVRRFGLHDLLEFNEEEVSWSKINIDKAINAYIKGTICLFNSPINEKVLEEKNYIFLYKMFVLKNKNNLNKLFVSDLLSETTECFIFSIVKYRTLLFRFIPTFIYNIFDLGRFLKDSYTYSNDGRYSLSFYNVPLILGKTSPLFFNIFQVDFFFNFPLGIFLSCLDFCAYSILRGNLTRKEKDKFPLFQRIFLVWRPFVSDDVDIPFISEKSEKEECYSAFASVVLKVLTNFVGVNFNIKVKGNYFFSINLMSFVDDFILREYFLDSFNYSSKNLRPSSWSIFYETNNKGRSNKE